MTPKAPNPVVTAVRTQLAEKMRAVGEATRKFYEAEAALDAAKAYRGHMERDATALAQWLTEQTGEDWFAQMGLRRDA